MRGQFPSNAHPKCRDSLKADNADQGIRDLEAVSDLALAHGMQLINKHTLPANNVLLVFFQKP